MSEPEQRNPHSSQAAQPSHSASSQTQQAAKSPAQGIRVLACLLCQQRKVKCDRRFPCANCTKHQIECVPATQARRRRRRFPEGELLGRLRKYEDLLRQNKVKFDPLHKDLVPREKESPEDCYGYDSEDEQRAQPHQRQQQPAVGSTDWSVPSTPVEPDHRPYEAKYAIFPSHLSFFVDGLFMPMVSTFSLLAKLANLLQKRLARHDPWCTYGP